ncbi:MAG: transposase [Symploca sp. SIO2G7]|nr:transposase [Symploca sp. SIO2G7]
MKFDSNLRNRRSIRLPEYDYTQPGAYFITTCSWQRQCLFGDINYGQIQLSRYGEVVKFNWFNLTRVYPHVNLDAFVIMPNHLHGIIVLTEHGKLNTSRKRHGLPEIVRGLKTFSARRINQLRNQRGIPIWQRGYYEKVIYNEQSLQNIREYIVNNPLGWEKDEMHPSKSFSFNNQISLKLEDRSQLVMNLNY